jgi:predicted amidohydrolase
MVDAPPSFAPDAAQAGLFILALRRARSTSRRQNKGSHVCRQRIRSSEPLPELDVVAPRCDGHSFAVDPFGRIIAMTGDSPGLTAVAFDIAAVRKARSDDRFRWQI